jgi:AraC-like DNA-binding protein
MQNMVLNFTIIELLAFLGLAQSVYILVYIFLRSNNFAKAIYPVVFFLTLGGAFFITVAQSQWRLPEDLYIQINLFLWTLCAPLSSLLSIQIARITKSPPLLFLPFLLFVPAVFIGLYVAAEKYSFNFTEALYIAGIIIGACSLLLIWLKRDVLNQLHKRHYGQERFWLIMVLITLNAALLTISFLSIGEVGSVQNFELIRTILGLSFLYIASTSLFRVYPPILKKSLKKEPGEKNLSQDDVEMALKIENLLHVEKIYQEPSYNRASLAKELSVSEAQLSRVVNGYFQKNVPLLLNELRVEEAKTLLRQTDADISTISEEAGFNSIATFNRVFKDIVAASPKEYRENHH